MAVALRDASDRSKAAPPACKRGYAPAASRTWGNHRVCLILHRGTSGRSISPRLMASSPGDDAHDGSRMTYRSALDRLVSPKGYSMRYLIQREVLAARDYENSIPFRPRWSGTYGCCDRARCCNSVSFSHVVTQSPMVLDLQGQVLFFSGFRVPPIGCPAVPSA